MSIRRINLVAGPGHRKTTVWHKLMAAVLEQGLPVEGVHEVAKKLVFRLSQGGQQVVPAYLQKRIFEQQFEEEMSRLEADVQLVINESSPFISYCHALFSTKLYHGDYRQLGLHPTEEHYHAEILPDMNAVLARLDDEYPALHILLSPPEDAGFSTRGRYQQSAEARALHLLEHAEAERRYPAETLLHTSTDDITGILHRIKLELT